MSITFKGRISRIFKADKFGNCRFSVDTTEPGLTRNRDGGVTCCYILAHCFSYMPIELTGEFEDDVFMVQSMKPVWIDIASSVEYLVKNCAGVGKKTAESIISEIGQELFLYSKASLREKLVASFPNMPFNKLDAIVNAVCITNDGLRKIEELLFPKKVPYDVIFSIYDAYGEDSYDVMSASPYITGEKFNIPLNVCDEIAMQNEVSDIDNERVTAYILNTLFGAAHLGHTYLTTSQLAVTLQKESKNSPYESDIPSLCISDALFNEKLFVLENGRVFLKRYRDMEHSVADSLKLLKEPTEFYTVTDEDIAIIENKLGIKYGSDQRNSFQLVSSNGVKIFLGGPGTGKSTTICGILEEVEMKKPGVSIALCAPTGRAAKRLSELTGRPAKTIHKLLDFRPYGKGDVSVKDRNNPIEADCIIVDESSMIDIELLALFLSAVRPGTLLIFVGDINQLPSVGPGNVLRDMVKSGMFPVYYLNENFRQGNGGTIYENGQRILYGMNPYHAKDFLIYHAKNEQDSYDALCRAAKQLYDKEHPFDMQIMAPSRKGVAGTFKMNLYLHKEIALESFPSLAEDEVGELPLINDKIIFTATDYERGYINGEIGIITAITDTEISIWNDLENFSVPRNSMSDIELAYANTIHKFQGSEADDVIIYLPEKMKHMMNRSLLYTAVTRAKKSVRIVFEGSALSYAIKNIDDQKRQTGLIELLVV